MPLSENPPEISSMDLKSGEIDELEGALS